MCGIIGTNTPISTKLFEMALDSLKNRGPDSRDIYQDTDSPIKLGHCRLSIVGLGEQGRQPMRSVDGRYYLVFNGEIYNYIELKQILEKKYSFRTNTDTEVLLYSFIEWKEECVKRFNGMYSFAIFDTKTKDFFCARDRLGIKPFYYCESEKGFSFASEIKALIALGIKKEINYELIYDYISFGLYDHTNETFFKGVKSLPAGHYLMYKNGNVYIEKYWDLDNPVIDYAEYTYEELQDKLRNLLEDSIKLRFRSDVPVGMNLSSGLDSNSILFFAKKVANSSMDLFSICVKNEKYNEELFIEKIISEKQKKRWYRSYTDWSDIPRLAYEMQKIQDQPFGGIPTIIYGELCKEIKKTNTIVVLEGQGGDELFAGYKYYLPSYFKDLFLKNNQKEIENWITYFSQTNSTSRDEAMKLIKKIINKNTSTLSQDMSKQLATSVLSLDFIDKYKDRSPLLVKKFDSHLLNAQYRDIKYTKLPRVLRFNDHASMAYGLELRLPFLDYRFVEFAFFLPNEFKISIGKQKRILRDAMLKIVPDLARESPKETYGAVQTPWLKDGLREWTFDKINSSAILKSGIFDSDKIEKELNAFFRDDNNNNSFFVWQWLNLTLWQENWSLD